MYCALQFPLFISMSEIQTLSSVQIFQSSDSDRKKCLKSKLSGNGMQLNCLKSKLVQISDIHCSTIWKYSRCPKTGRPVFGAFESCPVPKHKSRDYFLVAPQIIQLFPEHFLTTDVQDLYYGSIQMSQFKVVFFDYKNNKQ